LEQGLEWWEYSQLNTRRFLSERLITFAFVLNFTPLRARPRRECLQAVAPVIKLAAGATEDDHFALLGVLNSSTACFWLKQVCFDKGNRGTGGG